MKTSFVASLAFGLALASPAAGYASDQAPNPPHRHHIAHRQVVQHNPAVDVRAAAYAQPTAFALFGQWASPSSVQSGSVQETQGLSRNPDDCAKFGCIGNN